MKTCIKCRKEKALEDFPKRGEKRRGVCKGCTYEGKENGRENPAYDRFMAWFETLNLQP